MQGGILGIQAKKATNITQPTNKKPAIKGGKRKRGAAKAPHTSNHTEEERRGARRQQRTEGERDTHAPEGVRTCLSGCPKRGQGSYKDEYLSEGAQQHPNNTRKHGVEGQIPTQGPQAFVAMRHNEEGRQCATTLHAQRQGSQAVAGSNDTQREGPVKTWAKAPKRTIRGGGGGHVRQGTNKQNRTIIQGTNT